MKILVRRTDREVKVEGRPAWVWRGESVERVPVNVLILSWGYYSGDEWREGACDFDSAELESRDRFQFLGAMRVRLWSGWTPGAFESRFAVACQISAVMVERGHPLGEVSRDLIRRVVLGSCLRTAI